MFWHLGPEVVDALEAQDPQNPYLDHWREMQRQYAESTGAVGCATRYFWIVIRIKAENFSEHIEHIEEPPMFLPKEGHGEFSGIVTDKSELDALIEKESEEYVHLIFRAKIQGNSSWRTLLTFMGTHDMLSSFS